MWTLQGNEKTQEQLDAYPRPMKFKTDADNALTKKTISLASVMWRMIVKREITCYKYDDKETTQCGQNRLRSVEDIYSVAKTYVKKPITREDVEKAIDKLIKADLITQSFCTTVQRRVHGPKVLTATLSQFKKALK